MRTVLVTGSKGFIGQNLVVKLKELKEIKINTFNSKDDLCTLEKYIHDSDFIFHLAGVNRPEKEEEFEKVNRGFTKKIIDMLIGMNKRIPIAITSSIQIKNNNPYGKSKKMAEDEIIRYSEKYKVPVFIYRLPNVFGKWSKPNYNSVVSTFCYNISRDLDIFISDPEKEIELAYIDDVVSEFISLLKKNNQCPNNYYYIKKTFKITLKDLANRIIQIKNDRNNAIVSDLTDLFTKYLQATYLSFLDPENLSIKLEPKEDARGSFVEVLKSNGFGQISISKSNKGIVRGNHFHNTKCEKFCLIRGKAAIRFRNLYNDNTFVLFVSDKQLEIIDVPPGYTHSIENMTDGDGEIIFLIWANEIFDPENTDTYHCEV